MPDSAVRIGSLNVYCFSGSFGASRPRDIVVSEPFEGAFRYDQSATPLEVNLPEARYVDPQGLIDAVVGNWHVQSAGPVEIQLFSTPSTSRIALSATPVGQPGSMIRSCRVLLLAAGSIAAVEHLPAAKERWLACVVLSEPPFCGATANTCIGRSLLSGRHSPPTVSLV